MDKISSTNFLYARLSPSFFWKMTCFGYGHLFPRALLPSALCDSDWPISSFWMFTLAIKFLRDSWVKMTYLYYGLSMSFEIELFSIKIGPLRLLSGNFQSKFSINVKLYLINVRIKLINIENWPVELKNNLI